MRYLTRVPDLLVHESGPEHVLIVSFHEQPERVASLLNYFLVQLVGPKCAELKVRNPEKYNFDPKWLLRKIVAIYLHFSTQEQFAGAVASDGRSYNHEVFMKTTMILQRERLVSEVGGLGDHI